MAKREGDSAALFPFKLPCSFAIGGIYGEFDPDKEKQSNQVLRKMLHLYKDKVMALVDSENKRALEQANQYILALDAQLEKCKKTDEYIDWLGKPSVTFL